MIHSLDYLRRQAKLLKRGFQSEEPDALRRVQAVLGSAESIKHADALHVVAQELGYQSWPRLKLASSLADMDREARARRLGYALYAGQHWQTEALLNADPTLPRGHLGLQLALYDRPAVEAALMEDRRAAVEPIGGRAPILHLAFSKHIHGAPEKRADMMAIAEMLRAAGADVNASYPAEPGSAHRLSALYGALGHADNMELARWLLEQGANPNDDESLYHSTELGHHEGLKLLLRHGVRIAGTNALPRALDFDDVEAARLLLEAGADPNEGAATHPSGAPILTIPSLHQAARRRCSAPVVELLIAHGADGRAPYRGHSAYALARMRGAAEAARVIAAAGQATELDESEALLAAAADGAATTGRLDPEKLSEEARRIMTRVLGWPGALEHLKRLAAIGVDPSWTDEMDMPAAHIAAWEGWAPELDWLMSQHTDLEHHNAYGGDLLGTALHGADHAPKRAGQDHLACVQLILERGARLPKREIAGMGDEAIVGLLIDWAEAHPEQVDATPVDGG